MAEPDWDEVYKNAREAQRLLEAHTLTVEKLDELEKKAEKAAKGFGEVLEPFEQIRDQLDAIERNKVSAGL